MRPKSFRSVENQLIVDCILACFTGGWQARLHPYASVPINWDVLRSQARRHNVTGLVYQVLAEQTELAIPPPVMEQLRASFDAALFFNQARMVKFRQFLTRIQDITVILLKGPAVKALAYPKPALREYSDIDLLIRPKDWDRVRAVFQQLNYREIDTNFFAVPGYELARDEYNYDHSGVINTDDSNSTLFEVHWSLRLDLGRSEIWDRLLPLPDFAPHVYSLGIEDLIPYSCTHMARHSYRKLKWFVDILALVEQFDRKIDWPLVVQMYRRPGIGAFVYYGLSYTRKLFNCEVPFWVLEAFKPGVLRRVFIPPSLKERAVLPLNSTARAYKSWQFSMFILEGFHEKLKCLKAYIWPSDNAIRSRFPHTRSMGRIRRFFAYWSTLFHRNLPRRVRGN